jgi:hypothetical protein
MLIDVEGEDRCGTRHVPGMVRCPLVDQFPSRWEQISTTHLEPPPGVFPITTNSFSQRSTLTRYLVRPDFRVSIGAHW